MNKKPADILLILLFLLMISLPILEMEFHFFQKTPIAEQRQLTGLPKIEASLLFVKNFENYFNDNFGFRDTLIRLYNKTDMKVFGVSPLTKVLIGRNGWLFYKSEEASDGWSINDYRGIIPASQEQLFQSQNILQNMTNILTRKGITFMVIIAPSKHSVYDKYLPDNIKRLTNQTRLDQLLKYIKQNSSLSIFDYRMLLKTAELPYPTYYLTGTHLNQYGAFIVSAQILRELKPIYPNLGSLELSDFILTTVDNTIDKRLAQWISMDDEMKDFDIEFTSKKRLLAVDAKKNYSSDGSTFSKEIPNSNLPKLLVFCDSFGISLVKFLSEFFGKSVFLCSQNFNYETIDKEKPDIVIWETAERYLYKIML